MDLETGQSEYFALSVAPFSIVGFLIKISIEVWINHGCLLELMKSKCLIGRPVFIYTCFPYYWLVILLFWQREADRVSYWTWIGAGVNDGSQLSPYMIATFLSRATRSNLTCKKTSWNLFLTHTCLFKSLLIIFQFGLNHICFCSCIQAPLVIAEEDVRGW